MLAIFGIALATGGCDKGNLLLMKMNFERPEVAPTRARVGIQGVPRAQSNKYQAMLESQIVRVIEESGLFASVAREPFDPGQVDLSIQIEPAIIAFDRRVNMAYFPLALATLTLYIWVGGPVATDTEFYDVTLKVADAGGRHAFDVSTHETHTHWISIYSSEYRGALCKGPHAGEATAGLVKDLAAKLASAGFAATGRDRPGAR